MKTWAAVLLVMLGTGGEALAQDAVPSAQHIASKQDVTLEPNIAFNMAAARSEYRV